FMENFALKAVRMIERGKTSAPYAFVIPRDQRHAAEAADLVNYFRKVGSDVHVATAQFVVRDMPAVVERGLVAGSAAAGAGGPAGGRAGRVGGAPGAAGGAGGRGDSARAGGDTTRAAHSVTVIPGDWVVRMDQPYTALVRTVLAVQRFRPDDPSPYDDTGCSLDQLRHVTAYTITDSAVLTKPMRLLTGNASVTGTVAGSGGTLAVPHIGDWRSATLPWKVGGVKVSVADSAFTANGASFSAGTYLVENTAAVRDVVAQLGLKASALAAAPSVRSHTIQLPRV